MSDVNNRTDAESLRRSGAVYAMLYNSQQVREFEGDALAWWKAYKQAKGGDAWSYFDLGSFQRAVLSSVFPRAQTRRLKRSTIHPPIGE
ncbi:hypothetical protein Tco_0151302 [Tanacetum coccineum]